MSGDRPDPTTSEKATDTVDVIELVEALLGDVDGRKVLELNTTGGLAVRLAVDGAKAITLHPDVDRLDAVRTAATANDVRVECHEGEPGDLGFALSATIDVAVSVHGLDPVDDVGRILRQVHRVLKSGAPFVCIFDHPFAAVNDTVGYDQVRTVGDLLAAFDRSHFRVETFQELDLDARGIPTTLAVKLRKQGS